MIEVNTKLKAWGNSLGIIIPKDLLNSEGLSPEDEVSVIVKKKTSVVRDTFGTYSFKKNTDEILKEIDAAFEPKRK
ncbi:MAG: AbrB/MazE/SpoVT family DNA-binding domain-containing protein [archaeon]